MLRNINRDILIGILIASVFWVCVFVWQSSQPPYSASSKSERCENSNAECAKASVDERLAIYTWWLAVLTGGLVLTAVGQGYFLLRADRTTRLLVSETRRIGEAQTRAYVSIKAAGVNFMLEMSVPTVSFVASNSGQSPARNFIWNVILQYADPSVCRETEFNDRWLTSTGMDIPAASDAHPESAWVPMPARVHIETVTPGMVLCVVRLKIDFRYTDVFERDWFGEAYFSGIMEKRPTVSADGKVQSGWTARISPEPRPRDWDEVRKAQKT
jgi:hypothetical protein